MVMTVTNRTPAGYATKAAQLKTFWETRNQKFKDWYKTLRLDETELQRPNMETFISNDPRTLYNLGLYLLTSTPIPYNIPVDTSTGVDIAAIQETERYFRQSWGKLNRESRDKGRQDWLQYAAKLCLATGWYAVFTIVTDEGLIADVWNPAEVYPEYGDGLSAVAHIYTISRSGANRKAKENGWKIPPGTGPVKFVDYWEYNEAGDPENVVLADTAFVIPPTPWPQLGRIPVFVSPVGGLPDNGAIEETEDGWKATIGESIIATNTGVYRNYDKQLTFLQQILRDTAQPRFKERSKSGGILSPENVFVRGAIFRMDIDEDVGVIDMPSIPVELRTQLFDIQGMIQRGGFPWALYGSVQGDVTGYLMSQIAAAANQILKPYRDGLSFLMTDINNYWLWLMRNGVTPTEFRVPPTLPETSEFSVELKVHIPGDLALRANNARQLNPDFKLSWARTVDMLFPEITDLQEERSLVQMDEALNHPVAGQLALIAGLRDQANTLAAEGQSELARLYANAAAMAESQLQPPVAGNRNGGAPPGPPGQANALRAGG